MAYRDLWAKHGKGKSRQVLNRAVRAEIPGASHLFAALEAIHAETERPRQDRHPAQIRAIQQAKKTLLSLLDELRNTIIETYGIDSEEAQEKDAANGRVNENRVASIHAPQEATPTISLAALQKATPAPAGDRRDWTPPAAIVELMGKISDVQLAQMAGVSTTTIAAGRQRLGIEPAEADKATHLWTPAMDRLLGTRSDDDLAQHWGTLSAEAVRRRRIKLGISAQRKKTGWTEDMLQVLRGEPDNAKAAERLGLSVNAVKVARSRKLKGR